MKLKQFGPRWSMLSRMEWSWCESESGCNYNPRLATNIIFTTVVVSLLTAKYWLSRLRLRLFLSATKVRYLRISVFTGHPFCRFIVEMHGRVLKSFNFDLGKVKYMFLSEMIEVCSSFLKSCGWHAEALLKNLQFFHKKLMIKQSSTLKRLNKSFPIVGLVESS